MNDKINCDSVEKTRAIDPGMAYLNKTERCTCKKKLKTISIGVMLAAIILLILILTH